MKNDDFLNPSSKPCFIQKTEMLMKYMKSLNFEELKKLLQCSDEIADYNLKLYKDMDLERNLSPAILSYSGIQYKYMAPQVFETEYFNYIEKHLRILSGFYGILKPFDGVTPYRLEMNARLKTDFCKNLYDFWGSSIYDELTKCDDIILNLASDEYSKTVSKFLEKRIRYITCSFGEIIGGKVKEKGVYVKMARGEMVRFMAENEVVNVEEIKNFDRLGFKYNDILSADNNFVFIK